MIRAYGGKKLGFEREYIIPKPFDPRVLLWEAPAVARAAVESGVARQPIADFEAYKDALAVCDAQVSSRKVAVTEGA